MPPFVIASTRVTLSGLNGSVQTVNGNKDKKPVTEINATKLSVIQSVLPSFLC